MSSEVPSGWSEKRFGDVASVSRGLTYSNKQECPPEAEGAVCVLRIPNVQNQQFDPKDLKYIRGVNREQARKYRVPRRAILMVGSNGNAARVGNCCLVDVDGDYLFASFLMRVIPDERLTDSKFLYYVVAAGDIQDAITDSVEGSTGLKNISLAMLRRNRLIVPPLPEQKKIAAILSSADKAIQATRAVIEQTRRVKEALLQDLLTRGIGHTRFKQTEIGEIPEGWSLTCLEDLLVDGPTNGVYKPAEEIGHGSIIVGQTAFTSERTVDFDATRRAAATPDELLRFGLEDGDILVTRVYATPEGCGQPVFVQDVPEPSIYESNMMRIRPNRSSVRPAFLFNWLRNPLVRGYLMARASASNQTSINQKTLARLPCAVPPLQEQDYIVQVIAAASYAVQDCGAELFGLQQVKAGLLQDLLIGKVRVTV